MHNQQNSNNDPRQSQQDHAFEAALQGVTPVAPQLSWDELESKLREHAEPAAGSPQALATPSVPMAVWSHAATGLLGLTAGMLLMFAFQLVNGSAVGQATAAGMQQSGTERGVPGEDSEAQQAAQPKGSVDSTGPLLASQSPAATDSGAARSFAEEQVARLSDRAYRNVADVGQLVAGNHLVALRVEKRQLAFDSSSAEAPGSDFQTRWPRPDAPPPTPAALMRELLQGTRVF